MYTRMLCCVFVGIFGICAGAYPADPPQSTAADTAAGSVKTLKGEAVILRNGQEIPAELGSRVYAQDVLRTSKGGSLGIILRDDTTVSLGPSSELAMKEFAFKPNEGIFSAVFEHGQRHFRLCIGADCQAGARRGEKWRRRWVSWRFGERNSWRRSRGTHPSK